MSVAVLLLIAGVATLSLRPQPPVPSIAESPTPAPFDVAACRARIADLDWQARLQIAIADRLIQAEDQQRRLARAREVVARPSARQQLQGIRDQTAMLLIRDADRLSRHPDQRAAAVAVYRQAADLFPESVYAQLARNRLRELGA